MLLLEMQYGSSLVEEVRGEFLNLHTVQIKYQQPVNRATTIVFSIDNKQIKLKKT
jgi:hypothetical protein